MAVPAVCEGRGGQAFHLRDFGEKLDKVENAVEKALAAWPPPDEAAALKESLKRLWECRGCEVCVQDRKALNGALEKASRQLQEDLGSQSKDFLSELLARIEEFKKPVQKSLKVSADGTSELWFTHDTVRPRFSHGKHKGGSVDDLVNEIVGQQRNDDDAEIKLEFEVVYHHGRYKSLNNRRLWAVWEASGRLQRPLRVNVRVLPLLPNVKCGGNGGEAVASVLRKFAAAHTTKTNGDRPLMKKDKDTEMGEPAADPTEPLWLSKYRQACGSDGVPLRTSSLPLLDRLPEVARRIVNGSERIILLNGSTGCGKSTQVPQAVYDFVRARDGQGRGPSIVCTQPRRIAACSLDSQVNTDRWHRAVWEEERKPDSSIVAHQIQGQSNRRRDTRILFCTAGILLQMLRCGGQRGAREFQYVFLDEVHERTIEDDLLLTFMCSSAFLEGVTMKIIVMSATLSIPTYLGYFQTRLGDASGVGMIDIDSFAQIDQLNDVELRDLARASGLDLLDYEGETDLSELVQFMHRSQVVRPHPIRLIYLDDLLHAIACEENLQVDMIRPVGILEPNTVHIAREAWKAAVMDFNPLTKIELLLQILHVSQDGRAYKVVSAPREKFARHFCRLMMQHELRHHVVPIVNASELELVKTSMEGPILRKSLVLASGTVPKGAVITSYCEAPADLARDSWKQVTSVECLPDSFQRGLVLRLDNMILQDSTEDEVSVPPPHVGLVFLPGLSMVTDFQYAVQQYGYSGPGLATNEVRTLHGKVRQEDQADAVQGMQTGRRIILATNIAESSVTVPNADVVVDMCLARTMRWNSDRSGQLLDLAHATKDSLNQRAGRVARTKAGLVVRMITREEFDALEESRTPEMLRRPMDKVVLKVACMAPVGQSAGVDVSGELQACLSPPPADKIEEALADLQGVNAIKRVEPPRKRETEKSKRERWEVLCLGTILEDLPVDTRLGLIVAWALQLGCEVAAVDAVVILQSHNVMGEPQNTLGDSGRSFLKYCAQLRDFASGFPSDAVAYVNALRRFRCKARELHWVSSSANQEAERQLRVWCAQHYLNYQTMATVDETVVEIHKRLRALLPTVADQTEDDSQPKLPEADLTQDEAAVLMVLFAGSFHANMLQVLNDKPPSLLTVDERKGWSDKDMVVSWEESKNNLKTERSVVEFFKFGDSGLRGKKVSNSGVGMKGGWARIRLSDLRQSSAKVYGFPEEVTDMLKLSRLLSKLCGDGDTVMSMRHKASTRALPLFRRLEPITEKRQTVMLAVTSAATPYLEAAPLRNEQVQAALVPMRFESLETNGGQYWQKAEVMTLLPMRPECPGECRASFPEMVFAIFGPECGPCGQRQRLQPRCQSAEILLKLQRIPLQSAIRNKLTSPECLLEQRRTWDSKTWLEETALLFRSFMDALNTSGGAPLLKAMARQAPFPRTPEESSSEADDSDISDCELQSEPEALGAIPRNEGFPDGRQRSGTCVLLDFEYWWKQIGSRVPHVAQAFQANISVISQSAGNVHRVTVYNRLMRSETRKWALDELEAAASSPPLEVHHLSTASASEVPVAMAVQLLLHAGVVPSEGTVDFMPSNVVLFTADVGLKSALAAVHGRQDVAAWLAVVAGSEGCDSVRQLLRGKVIQIPAPPAEEPGVAQENVSSNRWRAKAPVNKERGIVKTFNPQKAYGFIHNRPGEQQDIYLPAANCLDGYIPLAGHQVFYRLGRQKSGKPIANEVQQATE